jgi:hypothetical protein
LIVNILQINKALHQDEEEAEEKEKEATNYFEKNSLSENLIVH